MNSSDFTLVVPCYNVADTLPETLAAIDELDPPPGRVLCVDDGSTDGTREILRNHPDIRLVAHETNRGLAATLNSALERTETPWFAKVDADVVVRPNWLEAMWEHCTDHEADLVQGRLVESVSTTADKWRNWHLTPPFPDEPRENKSINGSNILCRTAALRDVGGWNEQYRRAFDDIDLFDRLIEAGYTVQYTPEPAATHIRTDTWRDVLRTAWAYHQNYYGDGTYKPERLADIWNRAPVHAYRTVQFVLNDVLNRNSDLVWLSAIQSIYCVTRDAHYVYAQGR